MTMRSGAHCRRSSASAAPLGRCPPPRFSSSARGRPWSLVCHARSAHAAEEDGAAMAVARRCKEAWYSELRGPGPQLLVVLACETAPARPAAEGQPDLADVLALAGPSGPSLLPLRG